jgi:phosphate uptake regulator
MKDFSLKELQAIREAMEASLKSDEDFRSALKIIDDELDKMGYRFERKAFESKWKKIEKK